MKIDDLFKFYQKCSNTYSDIFEHLPVLADYAKKCRHITNMGTSIGNSAFAFLYGLACNNLTNKKLVCYDVCQCLKINELIQCSCDVDVVFEFIQKDVRNVIIEDTDLLFIDTLHIYEQLKIELELHSIKAKKYIIFHDTTTFGVSGEIAGTKGLMFAIDEFLKTNSKWKIKEKYENNNGLMILEKL